MAFIVTEFVEGDEARRIFDRLMEAAEAHGKPVYAELLALHQEQLTRERDKGEYAFAVHRRTVERIGLEDQDRTCACLLRAADGIEGGQPYLPTDHGWSAAASIC